MRILAKSNGSTAQIRLSPLKYSLFGTGEENPVKRQSRVPEKPWQFDWLRTLPHLVTGMVENRIMQRLEDGTPRRFAEPDLGEPPRTAEFRDHIRDRGTLRTLPPDVFERLRDDIPAHFPV